MPTYDQSNCLLAIRTTLEGWPAILTDLEGEDALSAPFVYRIRFATEAPVAAVKALIGTDVTLFFGQPDAQAPGLVRRRPLNGHFRRISRVGRVGRDGATLEWQAEVVPKLWFLSQTSGFRIFHDRTIPQIVAAILDEYGIAHADRIVVPEDYGTLEYCVQYDESALDFISRLLEHAGIFYWHEHTDTAHTMCFTDNNNNVRIPHPALDTLVVGDGTIDSFDEHYSFRTGTWTVRDHNLTRPQRAWDKTESFADVAGADPTVVAQFARLERYRFPGNYMARLRAAGDGSAEGQVGQRDADLMATRLVEIEESHWERWTGSSLAAAIDAGTKAGIDPDTGAGAADYLVIGVRHAVHDHSNWTDEEWRARRPDQGTPPAPLCTNTFDCVPHAVPFRPDRVTRKPRAGGPQTALVIGPPGKEINTDEFGRVQVQFLWDRAPPGTSGDPTACWLRVSQGWAGNGWGQIHVPRVGQEVIVDFITGDPDRPIVTGRVYDTDNPVPYALPGSATQSGIRTRSTPGGTAENYNELRFDDSIGAEQVLLHAERDYIVEVENNETRTVGIGSGTGDRTTAIKHNETVTIGGDRSVHVVGNAKESIDGNETRVVSLDLTETVIGGVMMTVRDHMDLTTSATKNRSDTVDSSQSIYLTADDSINLTASDVNIHARHHSRWSSEYDWQNGKGAGSFYLTTNFVAVLSTNSYVTAVSTIGLSLTFNAVSFTKDLFESKTAQLAQERKDVRIRNSLLAIEEGITELRQSSMVMEDALIHIMS